MDQSEDAGQVHRTLGVGETKEQSSRPENSYDSTNAKTARERMSGSIKLLKAI